MGEYDLVMFLQDNKIFVMEVDFNSNSKIIGFHGEDYFHYDNAVDIDDFYKKLADTYNVDNLSELDTKVFLIDCGMEDGIKWSLIDKLKSCEYLNIVNISCLLPILLSKKGLLQVGKQIVVEFLEGKYAYICDDEYHVEELATRGKKAKEILKMEDFSFIAVWKGNLTNGNNDDWEEKILEEQSKWDIKKKDLENEISSLNNTIETLENQCKELQDELQNNLKGENNKISQDKVNNRRLVKCLREDLGYKCRFIHQEVKNGEIVEVNQKIGAFIYTREYQDESRAIYAPRAGKLFWILLDGDDIYENAIFQDDVCILGVVGDEEDNENDMIEWAKMTEEEKKKEREKLDAEEVEDLIAATEAAKAK